MSDGFHKNMKNHNIDNKKKCHHIRVISWRIMWHWRCWK